MNMINVSAMLSNVRKTIAYDLMKHRASKVARGATDSELLSRIKYFNLPSLTKDEMQSINDVYAGLDIKIDNRYWQLYKVVLGGKISPCFIPDDIYVSRILRLLNPIKFASPLQNKNIYPVLYRELNQPQILINCINGVMRDRSDASLTLDKAEEVIRNAGEFIIKASRGTCGGRGVQRFDSLQTAESKEIRDLLLAYGDFFVVQKCVKQSEQTRKFNKTSLNTFRVNTLNLNGQTSVVNIMFRHGRDGAIVDNGGSGGICCGINVEGRFSGIAVDTKLDRYESTAFGEKYSDQVITVMPSICKTAINAHNMYLPMMGFAAWDFALDEHDNPVLIEVNLGWPGIMLEQMSNAAPIFGDRTHEVLEYCKKRLKTIHRNEFNGDWL